MGTADTDFMRDITEIVAALDEVPSPAALLDDRGTVRWQNRASLTLRGSRVGQAFSAYVSSDDRDKAWASFQAALDSHGPLDVDLDVLDIHERIDGTRSRLNAIDLPGGRRVVLALRLGGTSAPGGVSVGADDARAGLTPRQLDVLRFLDAGYSTSEIALALSLSRTTVRNHVANLLAALGVHSRLQAVAVARAAGILAP